MVGDGRRPGMGAKEVSPNKSLRRSGCKLTFHILKHRFRVVYFMMKESMMNRIIVATGLALGLAFTTMPASAVVYCKTVGVPKGCVARPTATVVRPAVVAAPGVSATNRNGGVNRVGVRR